MRINNPNITKEMLLKKAKNIYYTRYLGDMENFFEWKTVYFEGGGEVRSETMLDLIKNITQKEIIELYYKLDEFNNNLNVPIRILR